MNGMRALITTILLLASCSHPKPTPSTSLPPVKPTPTVAAAMSKLGFMRGVWEGVAEGKTPDGKHYKVTQTERMGPLLGGDVIVIEGRGYEADGSTAFNALAVVSWNLHTRAYEIRSYTQGHAGTFPLELTADGYVWQVPAGPGAVMRFTATVTADRWREVGDYVADGRPPVRSFEMNLSRVGDTDWPLTTPVSPRTPTTR